MKTISQHGKYGNMRKEYLQKNRPGFYSTLVQSGKLEQHLAKRDSLAREFVMYIFTDSIIRCPCPTEPEEMMSWVREMNTAIKSLEQMAIQQYITVN